MPLLLSDVHIGCIVYATSSGSCLCLSLAAIYAVVASEVHFSALTDCPVGLWNRFHAHGAAAGTKVHCDMDSAGGGWTLMMVNSDDGQNLFNGDRRMMWTDAE